MVFTLFIGTERKVERGSYYIPQVEINELPTNKIFLIKDKQFIFFYILELEIRKYTFKPFSFTFFLKLIFIPNDQQLFYLHYKTWKILPLTADSRFKFIS